MSRIMCFDQEIGGNVNATGVPFDNTGTGLSSTNVQGAISEVNGKFNSTSKVYSGLGLTVRVRKRNDVVTVSIMGTLTSAISASSATNLCNLDSEYRPVDQISGRSYANGSKVLYWTIYPNGNINVGYCTMSSGDNVQLTPITYVR